MVRRLFCMLLFTLPFFASGQDEHKKAAELFQQGKYKDAIVMLDESIATNPDWYYPILLKGQCNLKLKNYDEALRNFNDTLTLEPPSKTIPSIKYYIAKTHMALEDYPKAIHSFTDLLPLVPQGRHFDIYMNRGQCEMQIAKEAEEKKENTKSHSNYSKAVVSFSEALKVVNKDTPKSLEVEAAFQKAYAQYKIGNLKGGMQSLESSIKEFEVVLDRDPKEERAHSFIITLAFELIENTPKNQRPNRYDDAVRYIDRYLSNFPNQPEMMKKKGQALQGAKKYKQAIDVFNLVEKLTPNDGTLFFALGSCQMADKQFQSAISSYKKALQKGEKKNPSVYSYMAYCYQEQKTGCYQTDIPLYQDAVQILKEGQALLSGGAKQALGKDLERKQDNLNILRDNYATDEANHAAVLENIKALRVTLGANTSKLQRNQDLYIQQPTQELQQAIEAGKVAIQADKKKLSDELKTLQTYINDAKKCGGAGTFKNYDAMVAALNEK